MGNTIYENHFLFDSFNKYALLQGTNIVVRDAYYIKSSPMDPKV